MKKLRFFMLYCFLLFISCNNSSTSKKDNNNTGKTIVLPYIIDLEKNLNSVKSIPISNIGKKVEYIPLETTTNSLLRRIDQIVFSDSYIFISDFNKLLQFDINGKFIRQVGANGRGPGEYINVMGFCIDKKEKVYIIAWGINTVLEFDFNGKFISSFKQPFASFQFLITDTNSFIFHLVDQTKLTNDSNFSLYISDSVGTPITKIIKYRPRTSRPGISVPNSPLYFYDKSIRFMEFGVDTLNTLKNDKLEPFAIFNLGNLKMDTDPVIPLKNPGWDEAIEKLKQKLWIDKITENGQCLFLELDFGLSDSSKFCIFNKQTVETTFLENYGFKNDLDGGLTFWPKYVYNDSILVDYCEAYVLLKHIRSENSEDLKKKYGNNYLQLEKLRTGLNETSNPVLIILKPR